MSFTFVWCFSLVLHSCSLRCSACTLGLTLSIWRPLASVYMGLVYFGGGKKIFMTILAKETSNIARKLIPSCITIDPFDVSITFLKPVMMVFEASNMKNKLGALDSPFSPSIEAGPTVHRDKV